MRMKKQNVCWALIYVHKYILICMRNVVGEEKNYIDNIITVLFSSAKFKKVAEEVYIYRYSYTTARSVEPIQIWCTIIFEPKMQITAQCTLSPSL